MFLGSMNPTGNDRIEGPWLDPRDTSFAQAFGKGMVALANALTNLIVVFRAWAVIVNFTIEYAIIMIFVAIVPFVHPWNAFVSWRQCYVGFTRPAAVCPPRPAPVSVVVEAFMLCCQCIYERI